MRLDSQLLTQGKNHLDQSKPMVTPVTMSVKKWLIGILVIATLLRIGAAFYQGNTVMPLPGIYDQTSYHGLALRVAAGYGFDFAEDHWPATRGGEPTAHWSYLYTLYLATVYKILGVQPLIARLIQAVLAGLLQTWLIWRIGRHLFGATVGIIAAGLSAVYLYFVYYAGGLLTETFYIIGILWTFDVTFRLITRTKQEAVPAVSWRLWLELGLAIGVTVLLRQIFLLFVPFLFLWLWWTLPVPSQTVSNKTQLQKLIRWPVIKGLLGTTVVIVLLIAPWTFRNYRAFGTFVPLNTNAGFAFFWGNHPIYGTTFVGLLPADGPSYGDLIPDELRSLNEAELDQALLKRGIGFITADPVRYFWLSVSRSREYFMFWPSSESGLVSNIARVGSFGLFLPFMLYGLWLSAKYVWQPQDNYQRSEIILLYLFMVTYTGIHLLTWALIRYRLPVDAILLLFAALAIEQLINRFFLPRTNGMSTSPIRGEQN